MSDQGELQRIEADLADLQRRIDFLNDQRLDGVVGRIVATRGELRRVMNGPAKILRFDR